MEPIFLGGKHGCIQKLQRFIPRIEKNKNAMKCDKGSDLDTPFSKERMPSASKAEEQWFCGHMMPDQFTLHKHKIRTEGVVYIQTDSCDKDYNIMYIPRSHPWDLILTIIKHRMGLLSGLQILYRFIIWIIDITIMGQCHGFIIWIIDINITEAVLTTHSQLSTDTLFV